ncbi:MAG: LacI family transcriptional regulator [Gorillibacterium sp.]|nr:LacI family transcriptional regulator [Gorillibacterium sp.]
MNKKKVTLRMIADSLGLTVHTVSKALRGRPGMSEQTRTEVYKKAEQLGYRTKEQEHGLAVEQIPIYSSKPRRFAFIVPASGLLYLHSQLIQGVEERLSEFGHKLELLDAPRDGITEKDFINWQEDVGVLYSAGLFLPPMLDARTEDMLCDLDLPKILLNYPPHVARVDSVVWDASTAVHQSVRYLLSKGHRHILYIGNIELHRGFRLRWQAFQQALNAAGLSVDTLQHLTQSGLTHEQYSEQLLEIMVQGHPTALLVGLEQDLAWVYHTCRSQKISIPEDCSLIGLEHVPHSFFADLTRPTLLVKETGIRGADRMLWRISNPNLPFEHIRLQGGFHDGSTVSAVNPH